jgi:hypothetical protein
MTDLKVAVFTVLENWTLPPEVRKILETAYYAQPKQEPCECIDKVWCATFDRCKKND